MEYEGVNKIHSNIDFQSDDLNYLSLKENENSEYYRRAYEFIKNGSDNLRISNGPIGTATREEFIRSEELIESIIEEIKTEWTTKQKAAYVHYKMGEIISYTPDFCFSSKVGSKVAKDARNIWKSIENGKSVCNGIATIERNILSRIGVKTRELSSGTHSFVMIESEEGNILSDPTWDLTNTLFEGRPIYFGKTYEQLRELDGPLSKAHRLNNIPENIIEIPEMELREIYYSIGLTTEDRKFKFPILDKVNEINSQQFEENKEKVNAYLQMFTQTFPEQAMHLSETRTMIERCVPELGIDEKKITTKFVYSKEDKESEKPYLCLHIAGENIDGMVAVLNTEKMIFENIKIKEFDEKYKQHDEDTREPFWKKYLQREEHDITIRKDREEK